MRTDILFHDACDRTEVSQVLECEPFTREAPTRVEIWSHSVTEDLNQMVFI